MRLRLRKLLIYQDKHWMTALKKFGKEGAVHNTELTHDEEQLFVNCCFFMAKSSYPLSVSHKKPFAWAIACKRGRIS